ncbi:glycosyltransferase family 2 protein [Pluralibacter gergoviae]|uniref:glycosyltransferase family 2 protein n=1 Tax=Pluralibacter gergoviae TaxID=61647 RepID=UPI003312E8D9|nr:glycosyltransferase family 2 protein [Pluralibacter gergoviae]
MKISIIIPAYNAAYYLHECIGSIVVQNDIDYEIIVVNDGSTDHTESILRSIQKETKQLIYFTINNSGQSSARNYGAKRASGDFLLFVDADDKIESNTLSILRNVLDGHLVDMVFFNGSAFYDDVSLCNDHSFDYIRPTRYYNKEIDLFTFAKETIKNGEFIAQPCLYIFKRSMFLNNEFYPGIIHEDNLFTATLMLNHKAKCYVTEESLYLRRVRMESTMTTKKSNKNIQGYVTCGREITELKKINSFTLNCVVDRLSFIWFKESILINKYYQLDMLDYIKDEIKRSKVNFFVKYLLCNDYLLEILIKFINKIKSYKKVVS